jgi:predicted nucleotidyltransferase
MIDLLIRSKIRQKIIRLFLFNPKREFSIPEIASAVQTTPATAHRELRKLLEIDLVNFKKKGNLGIFNLNPYNYFLKEIRGIMKKSFGIEDDIKNALVEIDGIVFAFLFGSYVKGHFKTNSGIDLYIIGEVAEDKIQSAISPIKKFIGRDVHYHIASPKEFRSKRDKALIKKISRSSHLLIGNQDEFETFFS